MTNTRKDLKDRLWLAELSILEKWEIVGPNPDKTIPDVRTAREKKLMKVYEALRKSVDAVPATEIRKTTRLRNKRPDIFERTFVCVTDAVSDGFFLKTATEFVGILNLNLERHVRYQVTSPT